MADLQIYDPRERRIVAAADRVLAIGAGVARLWPRRAPASPPRRILLLRLERIGDLLMSAAAIESVRARAPEAAIDLVVGSWNRRSPSASTASIASRRSTRRGWRAAPPRPARGA